MGRGFNLTKSAQYAMKHSSAEISSLRARPRLFRKKFVLGTLAFVVAALAIFFTALAHRPAWYRPVGLTDDRLRQARLDAINLVDYVGDQLAEHRAFDLTITDSQCNEWLTGLAEIWPEAARKMPRQISSPFVLFQSGTIRTAAGVESKTLNAVVTSACQMVVSPDKKHLHVKLLSVHCGALPLPRFAHDWMASRILPYTLLKEFDSDQPDHHFVIENYFIWPNGKKPFRIGEITFQAGALRLKMQPL